MRHSDEIDESDEIPSNTGLGGGGIAMGCVALGCLGLVVVPFVTWTLVAPTVIPPVGFVGVYDAKTQTKLTADQLVIDAGIRKFKSETGSFPFTLKEIAEEYPTEFGELRDLTDPWGNPYWMDEREGAMTITSWGADGARGGLDEDTDYVWITF